MHRTSRMSQTLLEYEASKRADLERELRANQQLEARAARQWRHASSEPAAADEEGGRKLCSKTARALCSKTARRKALVVMARERKTLVMIAPQTTDTWIRQRQRRTKG